MSEQHALLPISDSLKKSLETASSGYCAALQLTPAMDDYLTAERCLPPETVRAARLGYVDEPAPGHVHVAGRLAIPYYCLASTVTGIRFRCLEAHDCKAIKCPKYLAIADVDTRLYFTYTYRRDHPDVHVTEGEIDALTLASLGLNVIGIPGANAWRPRWTRVLEGHQRVFVWGDPDEAGQKFNKTVTRAVRHAVPVPLEDHDVNGTHTALGAETLLEYLSLAA
ncbi:toprim domain-containing protein [Salininema proteolyticum]|uniref:Toprim domain-containing protein n=1 Tax=Salininema proteolyticum TaxID=1607685 RepID=A0ABV8TU42_9ACTN